MKSGYSTVTAEGSDNEQMMLKTKAGGKKGLHPNKIFHSF